jgi:hypothetical protein
MVMATGMLSCSSPNFAGTGTETSTKGSVAGRIVDQNGVAASRTVIQLVPAAYDPVSGASLPAVPTDTTSADGSYSFANVDSGDYNILAVHPDTRARGLVSGISVERDSVAAPVDTLRKPGSINVVLPDSFDATNGYVYVQGTTIYALLRGMNGSVPLDSVPAGPGLSICYAVKGSPAKPQIFRDSVSVAPGGVTTVTNVAWKFLKKLSLNTTASGANVQGIVENFPVLVRLNTGNFNFSQAQSSGNDIRFTKENGGSLPYEIERWDASQSSAEIWVKIDTIFGNDSTHFITMYWGNPNATSASNSAAVFDTTDGFQGVWHLNETTGQTAKDATGNHFDGTKLGSALPAPAAGAIGTAQQFDGSSSFIQMTGTADSKLSFPENGNYSLSAWVYVDTLVDSTTHVIASKGHEQYFLKLYWDGPHWEFTEYHDKSGWQVSSYSPVQAKAWKYLVGVRDGNNQYLYLDGELVTNSYGLAVSSIARNTSDDFSIGKYLRSAGYPGEGFSWFDGKIDEVRVSSKSLGADWTKLCYMNQKEPDVLVKW